jgi:putative membrane protein
MRLNIEAISGAIILVCSLDFLSFKKADDSFLSKASQANLSEMEEGKLAASMGESAEVKKYGQQMLNDHTAAQNDLLALAKKETVSLPKAADEEHQAIKMELMKLSGHAFDSAYLKNQLLDHQSAVVLFQAEIESGKDPDVIVYAKKYLPKLKMHLQMFQSAASESKNISGDSTK